MCLQNIFYCHNSHLNSKAWHISSCCCSWGTRYVCIVSEPRVLASHTFCFNLDVNLCKCPALHPWKLLSVEWVQELDVGGDGISFGHSLHCFRGCILQHNKIPNQHKKWLFCMKQQLLCASLEKIKIQFWSVCNMIRRGIRYWCTNTGTGPDSSIYTSTCSQNASLIPVFLLT